MTDLRAPEEYIKFFLSSYRKVMRFECLEFSHPSFSKTYYIVRNAIEGITVRYEDGNIYEHEYWPLKIQALSVTSTLESGIKVDLGDLGELLPMEIENVLRAGTINTKPIVKYRTYRSDNLNDILEGPFVLEIKTLSHNRDGCSFEAKAISLNITATGEIYDLQRFAPLRGFLY